jgi:3-isopropylmalate/(R)-2-methylmalate dehydratase small subunit
MQDPKRIVTKGKAVAVPGNDIDTDRIIPARYLRCVTFDDLGALAFEDDRKQLQAAGKTHPFDDATRGEASILVVGRNFGCGSSREHAPQALMRWGKGITAIVGESFAEIFFGNCVAIGVPCVTLAPAELQQLSDAVAADASLEVTVDLAAGKVSWGGRSAPASIPESAKNQLSTGRWDSTHELLQGLPEVERTAQKLAYLAGYRA